MQIGDWISTPEVNAHYRRARELGIESNILELEVFGFTIIEPEKVAPKAFTQRLIEATYELLAREDAADVALNSYENGAVDGRHVFHLIMKDPIFAEAMLNPVVMTLARLFTGERGRLNATVCFAKKGLAKPTRLHCDAVECFAPMPAFGHFINISYLVTDYTAENGTLAIVPGSNRWCRPPTPIEQPKALGGVNDEIAIPIIAKAGSIVAFNGNTWHGAYPKTDANADRIHLSYGFSKPYVLPGENYDDLPDALAEKYGPEFAQLVGKHDWKGWRTEGPNFQRQVDGEKARAAARMAAE